MRIGAKASSLALVLPLVLGLAACGGSGTDDDGGPDAGTGPEGANVPGTCDDGLDNDGDGRTDCEELSCETDPACQVSGAITIYDIQDETSPFRPDDGQVVTLEGVVVTAVGGGNFFVQEKDGGPLSGLQVHGRAEGLEIGDEVTVVGAYGEYYDMTQLDAVDGSVTVTAKGVALPEPVVVDAAAVATVKNEQGTLVNGADAEKYEGVLVQVRDVEVLEVGQYGDFTITGGLNVDDDFAWDYTRRAGDRFQSITGVLTYAYSYFRLLPRMNEDFTFEDGTHPAALVVTIPDIQNPDSGNRPAQNAAVQVEDVVITALSKPVDGRVNLFVQEAGGAEWSGIYVYNAKKIDLSGFAVGDVVTVNGTYSEYKDLSELTLTDLRKTGTGEVPAPHVATVAELTADATAEPWEGVLVAVENVTVPADGGSTSAVLEGGLKVDGILMGSEFPTMGAGTTIERLVGVLNWYQGWVVQPRGADDLVGLDLVAPQPAEELTIAQVRTAINAGTTGEKVTVADAVVTARRTDGFAIQQGTDPLGGIWVYSRNTSVTPPEVGSRVTVVGTTLDYWGLAEIEPSSVEVTATGVALPEPVLLTDPAQVGEDWESMLVKVEAASPLVVDAAPDQYGVWSVNEQAMWVDDRFWKPSTPVAAGESFTSIAGIVDFGYDLYHVNPRSEDDLVKVQ